MAKQHNSGMVYSTNPDLMKDEPVEEKATTEKAKQKLRVTLDKKQRAGKVITLISGFIGKDDDLQALAKELKTKCGAGGSVKEGAVMIQGDYREKVVGWLVGWGYENAK